MRLAWSRSCRPTGRGRSFPSVSDTSQATQRLMDEEVRRMIDSAHGEVTDLLAAHREQLGRLMSALLEAEKLEGIDAYRAATLTLHPHYEIMRNDPAE
jgi:cell division protease FtsH